MSTATSPLSGQIDEARKHGYSDEEIVGYLGKKRSDLTPKFEEAKKSGYASKDILDHLAAKPQPPTTTQTLAFPSRVGTEVIKGAVKEVGKRVLDFDEVLRKIPVVGKVLTPELNEPKEVERARDLTTSKGTAQKVGAFAEQTAEYLIPGPAEAEAARAVTKAIPGGIKGAKALRYLAEKAVRGTSAGAVSAVQTGSLKEGAKTAALAGPLSSAVESKALSRQAVDETTKRIAGLAKEVPGGLGMTTSEMADKPKTMNRIAQYLSSYSYLGQQGIKARRAAAAEKIGDTVDKWLGSLGFSSGPLGSGKVAGDALDSAKGAFKGEAQKLYSAVDQKAASAPSGPILVDTGTLKKAVATEADKNAFAKSAGIKQLSKPDPDSAKIFSDAQSVDKNITFENAQQMRSSLTDMLRKDNLDPKARRIASMGLSNLNQSMEAAAKQEPGLWKAYQSANDFYRHGMETFENEAVTQLMKRTPEALVNSVGKGQVSNALAIRRAMTQYIKYAKHEDAAQMQRGFDAFRDQWVRTQLLKAPERGAQIDLAGLKDRLQDMKGPIQALFRFDPKSRQMMQNIDTLGAAMSRMQKLGEHSMARIGESVALLSSVAGAIMGPVLGHPEAGLAAAKTGAGIAASEAAAAAIVNSLYSQKTLNRFISAMEAAAKNPTPENMGTFDALVRVLSQKATSDDEKPAAAPPPPRADSPTAGQTPPPPGQ